MHNNSTTLQLDGTYGHDSNLYKCVVRDYLRDRWPQIPSFKLNSLDSYIAETALTHGQDTNKPLRFAVVLPALESIPSLGSNSSLGEFYIVPGRWKAFTEIVNVLQFLLSALYPSSSRIKLVERR